MRNFFRNLRKHRKRQEKYKDADQRCEKLGLLIREKQEKLKKYQELEQLQKERIEIERQLENCKVQQKKIIRPGRTAAERNGTAENGTGTAGKF